MSPISGNAGNGSTHYNSGNTGDVSFRNYQSPLPEVYTGHPNRQTRYNQYAFMEQDAEIAACLDIISEFSTQQNEHNFTPFDIRYIGKPTPHEVDLVTKQLQQWSQLNEFAQRMFKIFRNTIVFGDQVFIRDPETYKLFWVDMSKVNRVIVNESDGKRPEQYILQDLNPNFQNLTVAAKTTSDFSPPASGYSSAYNMGVPPTGGNSNISGSRFTLGMNEGCIDAKHIVHLSLSEGLDRFWPFGQSVLESIFKVYKQKELLEDAILIYRITRAPERRVFKIDVGNMQGHMAMSYIERIKNEIHQRRIPSPHGGQANVDSAYSPMSINEDYYFPHCLTLDTEIPLLDGRTLTMEQIIQEFINGNENQLSVLSVNQQTLEVEPKRITWAGLTRLNAHLVSVTLSNNEIIRSTPDHKFIMCDGSEKCAVSLESGDLLMSTSTDKITVLEVKVLDYTEDTCDITVEDNHTFATKAGVYVHNSSDGRGSSVEVLPGGQNLDQIQDLRYWNNKLARGLRVPSSYLPQGPEDAPTPLSDGRVGTAMIQEHRFNQYCIRLQRYLSKTLDFEFKLFMKWRGFNIDSSLFELQFNAPQNFASYRQSELDGARVGTFQAMEAYPYISKRFALERFLGLSTEEINRNEQLWHEENSEPSDTAPTGSDLRSIGISNGDISADMDLGMEMDDMSTEPEAADMDTGVPTTPPAPTGEI